MLALSSLPSHGRPLLTCSPRHHRTPHFVLPSGNISRMPHTIIDRPSWLVLLCIPSSLLRPLVRSYWTTLEPGPSSPQVWRCRATFLPLGAPATSSDAMTLSRNKFTKATVRHKLPSLLRTSPRWLQTSARDVLGAYMNPFSAA